MRVARIDTFGRWAKMGSALGLESKESRESKGLRAGCATEFFGETEFHVPNMHHGIRCVNLSVSNRSF